MRHHIVNSILVGGDVIQVHSKFDVDVNDYRTWAIGRLISDAISNIDMSDAIIEQEIKKLKAG